LSSGDIFELTVVYTVGGVARPSNNVFHYQQVADNLTGEDAENLAQSFQDNALDALMACTSAANTCNLIRVRGVTVPTVGVDHSVSPGVDGGASGQTYALQTAALISWRTGLVGRHYQGRNYIPASTEDNVDGAGGLGTTLRGLLNDAAEAIMTLPASLTVSEYDLVIHSAPTTTPSWAGADTVVTSFSIADFLKTQRRRGL